jgi:hypothetical protein
MSQNPSNSMVETFELNLEFVGIQDGCHIFRLAFHSSSGRLLLPYPKVTGLQFARTTGEQLNGWRSPCLVSAPWDDFVLEPEARIAFDLRVPVNVEPDLKRLYTVTLPVETITAQYVYEVNVDRPWYDFLAKRSRFAAITIPWVGSVKSNAVQFTVVDSAV